MIAPVVLLRKWIDEKSHERLIPSDSIPVQRQLFRTDMETVLAALLMRTFWGCCGADDQFMSSAKLNSSEGY